MMNKIVLDPSDLEEFMRKNHIPGEILHLDVPTPTVETAAAAVGSDLESIVKSLLFTINDNLVLAITCGPTHIDRRAIAAFFQVGSHRLPGWGDASLWSSRPFEHLD
jgi:prolyl-tRNA editing enzyme YbaK/EbsC (Cys-tRNA(Pro) deacylase)